MELMAVLADPVRREIIDVLRRRPLAAGEIAARFPISRPAISRHLRLLGEAGLVTVESVGRRRVYRFEPGPLIELDTWLQQYRDLWNGRLDALETEVYRTRREHRERSAGEPARATTGRKESA